MATQFLWSSGVGGPPNTGLVVAAVTLMSSDIVSSAGNTTGLISSGTGQSLITLGSSVAGMFASSFFGQAMMGDIFITHGTSQTTALSAGANIAGWWLTSPDFSTFEITAGSSASALPRPPDWIVPHSSTAIAAGTVFRSQGAVAIPSLPFKIFIQNNTGQTLFSSATAYPTIKIAPYAMQY